MRKFSGAAKAGLFSVAGLLACNGLSSAVHAQTVTFNQESFSWDTDTDSESTVGQSLVNGVATDSYLNIADAGGNWVVQNEFVPAGQTISASFALTNISDGSNEASLTYSQSVTSTPLSNYAYNPGGSLTSPVGDQDFDYEGADNGSGDYDPAAGFKPAAPSPGAIVFTAGGQTLTIVYRPGVPNIQAADNQCVPASLANGLKWLKDTQGLNVTQANSTGLKGDATLVGVMDTDTNRPVTSRTIGVGVTAASQIDGMLRYLDDNNLTFVTVKHEGFASAANRSVTSSGRTTTSTAVAGVVDFQFIIDALQAGAAVQVWESWANGAHAVEVTGAGYALGVPWITFTSDLLQTPRDNGFFGGLIPPDSFGTSQVNFSYLGQPDAFGRLRFLNEAGKPTLTFAISEAVPEPATLGTFAIAAAAAALATRRRRRI